MEFLNFDICSTEAPNGVFGTTAGVVNSGNLEILIEKNTNKANASFSVGTPIKGFFPMWEAVLTDFASQFSVGGLKFTLNDSGAVPAVVALRLRQAYEAYAGRAKLPVQPSYAELTPRQRIEEIVDEGSFIEICPPFEKVSSPHLTQLDMLGAFDDGIVIGDAKLNGEKIVIAAQNYAFIGGAVGEVNGAKLTGICLRAIEKKAKAIVLLLDSGGVRLHEANAGETAISEIIQAILAARRNSIPVIAFVGGKNGAFGGIGIISACADHLFMTELGRAGVSGPEVIETVMGVEEYDSSDRALVWRTCGGKNRSLLKHALYVGQALNEIKRAVSDVLSNPVSVDMESLETEHKRLKELMDNFADCKDGCDIWKKLGIAEPQKMPALNDKDFLSLLQSVRRAR